MKNQNSESDIKSLKFKYDYSKLDEFLTIDIGPKDLAREFENFHCSFTKAITELYCEKDGSRENGAAISFGSADYIDTFHELFQILEDLPLNENKED
jgi:hypothetical protein